MAIVVGALAFTVVMTLLVVGYRTRVLDVDRPGATAPAVRPSIMPLASETHPGSETGRGFVHGRITTFDGAVYEGRIRFGGDEEAFWGDTFNGAKVDNPWAAHVPEERLPRENRPVEILGLEIARPERPLDLGRPFMARFGDIARIEARGDDVRVMLRSGTAFGLDRFSASDFDDGGFRGDLRKGWIERGEVQYIKPKP